MLFYVKLDIANYKFPKRRRKKLRRHMPSGKALAQKNKMFYILV